jgi:hypothetical protein
MVSEQPNRAERRRQEKEQAKESENEYGAVAPRSFAECPVCHCPARFTLDALKGEISDDVLKGRSLSLGMMKYLYYTPIYEIELRVIYDSCRRCGAIYTVARDKVKRLRISKPGSGQAGFVIGKG